MNTNKLLSYSLAALACLSIVGCSKSNEEQSVPQKNQANNTSEEVHSAPQPANTLTDNKQPLSIEGGGASIVQPRVQLRPRVIIPDSLGNAKNLLDGLAQKYGYTVDWRLKGYYNLDKSTLEQYNQPIGFTLPLLTDLMSYANKTMKAYWGESNPGEPFPYPTDVGYFVCGKTIVLFEMDNPQPNLTIQYTVAELLKKPEYKQCFIPDVMLGMNVNISENSQPGVIAVDANNQLPNVQEQKEFNFNSPPPFVGNQNTGVQMDIQQVMPNGMNWSMPKNQSPVRVPIDSLK